MNKRKSIAALGALVLALICTFALVRYVKGAEERAVAGEDLVDVLVATADIKAGTTGADLGSKVSTISVQAKVRPDNAVTTFEQIEGLVPSVDLVKGEQLLSTRFVNPGAFQGARSSSAVLPKGANEVTFKLAAERALGGQLRPGDTVTVMAAFDPFDPDVAAEQGAAKFKTPNTAHVLLNKITVVRIQFPENVSASNKEKNGVGLAPTQDLYVTLAVDQPSLARAVFAAEFGKVWLSYEPSGADASQNKTITRDNVYDPTRSLLPAPVAQTEVSRTSNPSDG
jgi:pilus assembly protein CpaB